MHTDTLNLSKPGEAKYAPHIAWALFVSRKKSRGKGGPLGSLGLTVQTRLPNDPGEPDGTFGSPFGDPGQHRISL